MLCTLQAGGGRLRWRPFSKQPWVIICSNILPPCRWAPVLLSGGEWACICFTSGWKESFQANSLVNVQFTWGNNVSAVFFLFFPECFKIYYVDFGNMIHTYCMGIFYTKELIQWFLTGEKRQRIVVVWVAYLWFELFMQLCAKSMKRKVQECKQIGEITTER